MGSAWTSMLAWLALTAALPGLAQGQNAPAAKPGVATQGKMYVAPQVETPDFSNLTLQQVNQANQTTVDAKEAAIFNRVTPVGPVDGVVASQIPVAGTRVYPGREALTVTMRAVPVKQQPLTSVPPLTGMSLANARLALQQASLQVGQVSGQAKSQGALSIVNQTPAAGSRVAVGSAVDVTVEPPPQMYVPDVTGMTVAGAAAKFQTFQLQLGQVTSQTTNWAGLKIVSQSPKAGTAVALGTAVGVTLEPPPPPRVLVPGLTGRTVAQAEMTLSGLGLELGAVKGKVKGQATQTIGGQTPSAGTQVATGTPVDVTLDAPQAMAPELPEPQTPPNSSGNGPSLGWVVAGGSVLLTVAAGLGLLLGRRIWPSRTKDEAVTPSIPLSASVPPPIVTMKPEANLTQSKMRVSAQPAIRMLVQLRGRPARAKYDVGRSEAIVTRKDSRE